LYETILTTILLDHKALPATVFKDMGRLLAFIVTYEPAFTNFKIDFAREIYYALEMRLPLNRCRVIAETSKEFDAIRERRNMEIPEDIVEKIMKEDLSF